MAACNMEPEAAAEAWWIWRDQEGTAGHGSVGVQGRRLVRTRSPVPTGDRRRIVCARGVVTKVCVHLTSGPKNHMDTHVMGWCKQQVKKGF